MLYTRKLSLLLIEKKIVIIQYKGKSINKVHIYIGIPGLVSDEILWSLWFFEFSTFLGGVKF